MPDDLHRAVRDACLWLPEAEEFLSHGSPNFKVRGKTFATYVVNHHGDGRIALWLNLPPGAQQSHVDADPERFFVPPYVGPRGWLGVRLDKRVPWKRIAALLREAYERVAPPALGLAIGVPPALEAPAKSPSLRDIDPMQSKRGQAVLKMMRSICLALPEAREVLQFGYPVWQAGKKTFAWARCVEQRLCVIFWVGVEAQGLLTADTRYAIPAYMGHNGWIALDVHVSCDRAEVESLALASYRHFALRRMLQSLSLEVK
jgi:predicted DNA-binding protein (MmcQ/YjbR family)